MSMREVKKAVTPPAEVADAKAGRRPGAAKGGRPGPPPWLGGAFMGQSRDRQIRRAKPPLVEGVESPSGGMYPAGTLRRDSDTLAEHDVGVGGLR